MEKEMEKEKENTKLFKPITFCYFFLLLVFLKKQKAISIGLSKSHRQRTDDSCTFFLTLDYFKKKI